MKLIRVKKEDSESEYKIKFKKYKIEFMATKYKIFESGTVTVKNASSFKNACLKAFPGFKFEHNQDRASLGQYKMIDKWATIGILVEFVK